MSTPSPIPAPTVREIGEAVAQVNDWRALGIFVLAIMLIQLVLIVWLVISLVKANKPVIETVIPVRIAMEAASEGLSNVRAELTSLTGQIANLTQQVGVNGSETQAANQKLSALAEEVDRIQKEMGQ